jgi:hypothetical protein
MKIATYFVLLMVSVGFIFAQGSSVTPDARYKGNFGIRFDLAGTTGQDTLTDGLVEPVSTYNARFYLNIEDLNLPFDTFGALTIFQGENSGTNEVEVLLELGRDGNGVPVLTGVALNDDGTRREGATTLPESFWFAIEFAWTADATNGALTVMVDGLELINISGVNNGNALIDRVRAGIVATESNVSGTFDMDDFASRKFTTIGTLCITAQENFGFQTDFPARNMIELVEFVNVGCAQPVFKN